MLVLQSALDSHGIPFVSTSILERYATGLIFDYNPELIKIPQAIDIQDFAADYFHAAIQECSLTPDQSILAMTSFEDGTVEVFDETKGWVPKKIQAYDVFIEKAITSQKQYNFTLAHELAHLALHKEVELTMNYCRTSSFKDLRKIYCCKPDFKRQRTIANDAEWVEWQANSLASSILMPSPVMCIAYKELEEGAGDELSDFTKILTKLSNLFMVSEEAVFVRLKKLCLI